MRRKIRRGCPLLLLSLAFYPPPAIAACSNGQALSVELHPVVTNLEYATFDLMPQPFGTIAQVPHLAGEARYGQIVRRMPDDSIDETEHFVPFLVEYVGGVATRIWVDENFNGNLADDPSLPLFLYPPVARARCAITGLSWSAGAEAGGTRITSLIRIVMEPMGSGDTAAHCRLQNVYAMQGIVPVDGRSHLLILYDGNGDGIYTKVPLDGLLIDLNDDRHFNVDVSSEEFYPMRVSFQIGRSVLEVASVDPTGRTLVLKRVGDLPSTARAKVGSPAPDFQCYDTGGRRFRLSDRRGRPVVLYFWASWCNFCKGQTQALTSLYRDLQANGGEILGISLDTEKSAMASFREETKEPWPTTFTGRTYWEDPVARLFGVDGAGGCYLIDRDGRYLGVYFSPIKLGEKLAALTGETLTGSER